MKKTFECLKKTVTATNHTWGSQQITLNTKNVVLRPYIETFIIFAPDFYRLNLLENAKKELSSDESIKSFWWDRHRFVHIFNSE